MLRASVSVTVNGGGDQRKRRGLEMGICDAERAYVGDKDSQCDGGLAQDEGGAAQRQGLCRGQAVISQHGFDDGHDAGNELIPNGRGHSALFSQRE